ALAFSHSCALISLKPSPLQEFWPLQEFFAEEQSLLPLQLLTPSQWTLPPSSVARTGVAVPMANKPAAAAAIAAPVSPLMLDSMVVLIVTPSAECAFVSSALPSAQHK